MTGSEVGRVLACPESEVLPRSDEATSEWTGVGEERHRDAETAANLGALDELPPRVAAAIDGASRLQTETVYVYCTLTRTARVMPGIRSRAYEQLQLAPHEIALTLDLVALFDEPRRAVVVDHKLFTDQGDPLQHGQVMTQALAVAKAWGLHEVTIQISYLGSPSGWVRTARADVFDLADHADRLAALPARIAAARANPQPAAGAHCRHCPVFFRCPAWADLLRDAISGTIAERVLAPAPFEDDEAAAGGLQLAERLEVLAKRLAAALESRARRRPIPLADGMAWGPHPTKGLERLDGAKVFAAANERFAGTAAAFDFVELSATKKRIDEAIAKRAPRGKKTAMLESFLEDVRARGGASRTPGIKYGPHDPSKIIAAPPPPDALQEAAEALELEQPPQ